MAALTEAVLDIADLPDYKLSLSDLHPVAAWNDFYATFDQVCEVLVRLHNETIKAMDIGEPVKEVEFEPIYEPAAPPVETPAPAPEPAEPVKEPVPA